MQAGSAVDAALIAYFSRSGGKKGGGESDWYSIQMRVEALDATNMSDLVRALLSDAKATKGLFNAVVTQMSAVDDKVLSVLVQEILAGNRDHKLELSVLRKGFVDSSDERARQIWKAVQLFGIGEQKEQFLKLWGVKKRVKGFSGSLPTPRSSVASSSVGMEMDDFRQRSVSTPPPSDRINPSWVTGSPTLSPAAKWRHSECFGSRAKTSKS